MLHLPAEDTVVMFISLWKCAMCKVWNGSEHNTNGLPFRTSNWFIMEVVHVGFIIHLWGWKKDGRMIVLFIHRGSASQFALAVLCVIKNPSFFLKLCRRKICQAAQILLILLSCWSLGNLACYLLFWKMLTSRWAYFCSWPPIIFTIFDIYW